MGLTGKVWLVGAGPGDSELITVKGKKVLTRADVVVYDALAGDGILGLIPRTAETIYVGKRAGRHETGQEEIQQILLREAGLGRQVVRLKGGDPFVFGRGGEEAAFLAQHQIPFEVVPGVTSAVAVPAYGGIPATHRGLSSSFHVITGHGKGGEPVHIDYEALVRTGGTLIFLMGLSSIDKILGGLLDAGIAPDMPAALLQQGTTARQEKVIATVSTLAGSAKKAGIKAPAIMVAGEVCSLFHVCEWAERRPLHGKKVLVTRPVGLASQMEEMLLETGAEAVGFPTIETRLIANNKRLLKALDCLEEYQWLVLTSPSGVRLFFEAMAGKKMDVRRLHGLKVAAIGGGTAGCLKERGIYADYVPENYDSVSLGYGLADMAEWDENILILRAQNGSPALTEILEEKGFFFDDVPLYETVYPDPPGWTDHIRDQLISGEFDYVTFTSASTVRGFKEIIRPDRKILSSFTAVCIGEQTAKQARECGMTAITPWGARIDSMVECMIADCAVHHR